MKYDSITIANEHLHLDKNNSNKVVVVFVSAISNKPVKVLIVKVEAMLRY